MAAPGIREEIARAVTAEQIQKILDKCMDMTTTKYVTCPRDKHKFDVEMFDAKIAMDAVKWAVEQGFGRVPNAPQVGPVAPPTVYADEIARMSDAELASLAAGG